MRHRPFVLTPVPPIDRRLFLALAIVLFLGCGGQDPAGPAAPVALENSSYSSLVASSSQGDFFPLQIGNRWEYTSQIIIQIETDEGPQAPQIFDVHRTRTLVGEEVQFGRRYVVEDVEIDEGGEPLHQKILYRQDKSGLYEADLFITGLPESSPRSRLVLPTLKNPQPSSKNPEFAQACKNALSELERRLQAVRKLRSSALSKGPAVKSSVAADSPSIFPTPMNGSGRPGGLEDHELLRLQYPLHPGAEWTVRDDDVFFSSRVDGHETLHLPVGTVPAWRIRIEASVLGPNDDVRFYYSRMGYAGMHTVLWGQLTDENGEVIGTMLLVEQEVLDAVSIPKSGKPQAASLVDGR